MRSSLSKVAVCAVLAVFTSGCFTTRINSGRPAAGPQYDRRQWFTIGGLIPISGPAGQECQEGLATAESQIAVVDFLINIGLGVVGGIVGYAVCSGGTGATPEQDAAARTSCATVGGSLVPWLLATRTVRYSCAAGGMSSGLVDPVVADPNAVASTP